MYIYIYIYIHTYIHTYIYIYITHKYQSLAASAFIFRISLMMLDRSTTSTWMRDV